MTIKTLEYVKKEARGIINSWDGSSERFIYDGDVFTEEHAHIAQSVLAKIEEIEALVELLAI